jgi:GNAT superfamily N-acetyltransferase
VVGGGAAGTVRILAWDRRDMPGGVIVATSKLGPMALAQVRPAVPADAADIARIQRIVWTTAYADFLPPGVVDGFDDDAVAVGWASSIEAGGAGRVWVATEGADVVGFVGAGPADADDLTDATGALPDDRERVGTVATLLVEPRWGRRGHAGRLLVEAAAFLREAGCERAVAWIPERDGPSRAFYARAGWGPDGTVRVLDAGGRPLRELRVEGPVDLEFAPEPTAADLGLPLLE